MAGEHLSKRSRFFVVRSFFGIPLACHFTSCYNENRMDGNHRDVPAIEGGSKMDKAGYDGWCGLEYKPLLDPVESLKLTKKLYA